MIRYWIWDRLLCRWVRVVTSRAVWAATPKAIGVLVCVGVTGPAMAPLPPLPHPTPVVLASPEWPMPTHWPTLPPVEWEIPPIGALPPLVPPTFEVERRVAADVPEPAWAALAGLLALMGIKWRNAR